ncbi:hypothetical protein B0681_07805, partial [Moraxella porci DSM 25326]
GTDVTATNKDAAKNEGSETKASKDTDAPEVQNIEVPADGNSIVLTYDEPLDPNNPPKPEDFKVTVNGEPVTPTVKVEGDKVTLVLPEPVKAGETVKVSYTDPTAENDTAATQDVAGNDAESFTDLPVKNNSEVPNPNKPDAPTGVVVTDDVPAIVGEITNGTVTNDDMPTFSGTDANPGDTITVTLTDKDGNETSVTTTVKPDGTWTVDTSDLPDGTYTSEITATDPKGNTSDTTKGPTFTVDTKIPGDTNGDGIVDDKDDSTKEVTLPDGTKVPANTDGAPNIVFGEDANGDGVLNAGEIGTDGKTPVHITIPDGTELGDTLVVTINGEEKEIPVTQDMLDKGYHTEEVPTADLTEIEITAKVTDPAGNESATAEGKVTVDTKIPGDTNGDGIVDDKDDSTKEVTLPDGTKVPANTDGAPNIVFGEDKVDPNTGKKDDILNADEIGPDNSTPAYITTPDGSETGDLMLVKVDGVPVDRDGNPVTDPDYKGFPLTETDITTGYVTVPVSTADKDGKDITVTAQVTDAAGNSSAEGSKTVSVDTTVGENNGINITAISEDTGAKTDDFVTNDNTLVVSGTLAAPLAADEKVQVSLDGGKTWIDAPTSGTTWTADATGTTLPAGETTIQARIVDTVGNVGPTDDQVVTIDTTEPSTLVTAVTIMMDNNPDDGTINATEKGTETTTDIKVDFTTDADANLEAKAGDIIELTVTIDGVPTKIEHILTATEAADGTYTFTGIDLPAENGTLTAVASITKDAAGNVNDAVAEASDTAKLDAIASTLTVDGVVDNSTGTVDITGTSTDVPANATVTVTIANKDKDGNTVTATATTDANGSYTISDIDVSTLTDGELIITAKATDNNGDEVNATDSNNTLEITPPTATVMITSDDGDYADLNLNVYTDKKAQYANDGWLNFGELYDQNIHMVTGLTEGSITIPQDAQVGDVYVVKYKLADGTETVISQYTVGTDINAGDTANFTIPSEAMDWKQTDKVENFGINTAMEQTSIGKIEIFAEATRGKISVDGQSDVAYTDLVVPSSVQHIDDVTGAVTNATLKVGSTTATITGVIDDAIFLKGSVLELSFDNGASYVPVTIDFDNQLPSYKDQPQYTKWTYTLQGTENLVVGENKVLFKVQDLSGNYGEGILNVQYSQTPTININSIAGDAEVTEGTDGYATITVAEAAAGFTVSGTTANVEAGQTVTVTITGSGSASIPVEVTTTVGVDGKWTASVPADELKVSANETFTVVAKTSNVAGTAATDTDITDKTPQPPVASDL